LRNSMASMFWSNKPKEEAGMCGRCIYLQVRGVVPTCR
jgi:hypothetical protein